MQHGSPTFVGTVGLQENENISTRTPWEAVTTDCSPFSVVTQPHGFMFAHGSACASLATTSRGGWTYVSDVYFFRRDGNAIDLDRYLGSITPTNSLAILKVHNSLVTQHHLKPTDPISITYPLISKSRF